MSDLRLGHLPAEPEKHNRWREMLVQLRAASGWDEPAPEGVG